MVTPKFLDPLEVREYSTRFWELTREFRYQTAVGGGARIVVEAGFLTDFSSVPRVPLAFWLTGDTGRKAGLVHDWCYTRQFWHREQADALFLEALEAEGVCWWRRWLMYRAVRRWGGSHWA